MRYSDYSFWKYLLLSSAAAVFMVAVGSMFVCGAANAESFESRWELSEGYYTVVDEMGQELLITGHIINIGDQFICEENRKFEVHQVRDRRAHVRFVERVDLSEASIKDKSGPGPLEKNIPAAFSQDEEKIDIGIYHTHSAESYIPESNTHSVEGGGDILQVGGELRDQLKNRGMNAEHDATIHCPHDAGAYTRSRRTALALARKQPGALFDVHRDTGPRGDYATEIDGEDAARILLVVGRQNPNHEANSGFSKALKEAADEQYPGLVKGILLGQGDYNQDIGPRSLVLEVGSEEVTLQEARNGVALLSDVIPEVLPEAGERESYWSVWWLVSALLIGGGLFLYISTGSWEEAYKRLGQYLPRELGRPR